MGRAEDIFENIKQNGLSAIDEFILQRQSEELFLDFKISGDAGRGPKLHESDRKNLAKMISAFGNSSGGVIVWGVDCSYNPLDYSDLPRGKKPILDGHRFIARLEGAVSGCTLPAHQKVIHFPVCVPNSTEGYVVTLIPESSMAPHQDLNDGNYYIRAGSNCVRAPHSVLAGMFGKKPTPNIFLMFMKTPAQLYGPMGMPRTAANTLVKLQFGFILAHQTPIIARDLYFSLQCLRSPGPKCKIEWVPDNTGNWSGHVAFGVRYSVTSVDKFKLPPETHAKPGGIQITLMPPFEKELGFECWWGCASSPIQHLKHLTPAEKLVEAWDKYIQDPESRKNANWGHNFTDMILPLGEK